MINKPLSYFLNHYDIDFYKNYFKKISEYRGSDKISFQDFFDIIVHSKKNYDNSVIQIALEKIRTNMDNGILQDSQVLLDLDKFFDLLNIVEQEKYKNENQSNPEIKFLFHLLCDDKETVSRAKISNIIKIYDLPIIIDDFFAIIGRKQEITYTEFCCLWNSNNEYSEIKIRSKSNNKVEKSSDNYSFPILIRNKNYYKEV